MSQLLNVRLSKPLEREYEAWITQNIQDYFQQLGIVAHVWAVSPTVEVTWPADEHLFTDGKMLGLQFKQAKLAHTKG